MTNTLFGGKVKVRALTVTDKPAERTEVQARLLSPGGELVVLFDGVHPIQHLGYLELIAGKPRGNHYHKLRNESLYLISGEVELHLRDRATDERSMVLLQTGDLAQIAPEVSHVWLPRIAGAAIEFAPEMFDAADVYRDLLI
jgi:hypothetical protein